MKKVSHGFTAVELLITLVISVMLLVTAYQLYTFILNDSADARLRASASNLAYRFMREASATVTNPCTVISTSPDVPDTANLPTNATATVTITCPNTGATTPFVTATITYGNGKVVTHASYATVD